MTYTPVTVFCTFHNKYIHLDTVIHSGASLNEVKSLVFYILTKCPHLHFQGLLTLGHLTDDLKTIECFNELRRLKGSFMEEFNQRWPTDEIPKSDLQMKSDHPFVPTQFVLSMGMTGDMEKAIECGSTELRIGTAIFGSRT